MKKPKVKLFRGNLKKANAIYYDLRASFDHGSSIILSKDNQKKLDEAINLTYQLIGKLNEIE